MILLTGASGFIGKHLLTALVKQYGKDNVLALTSAPIQECPYLLHHGYTFDANYFADHGYGDSITAVIHAGAFIPKSSRQANDWRQCNQNIYNTEVLLRANLPQVKKFVYISTVDVYGKNDLIVEDTIVDPVSLYGHSKLYCEKMVNAWGEAGNKIVQILRVGHVYGPGEEAYEKIIPIGFNKIRKGESVQIWGTGNDLRSFIYITDIVYAILCALELDKNAGVINLASSQSVSIKELVNTMFLVSKKDHTIEWITTQIPGRNLIFDNSKMKQYLLPLETPLEKGLLEEWEYMKRL